MVVSISGAMGPYAPFDLRLLQCDENLMMSRSIYLGYNDIYAEAGLEPAIIGLHDQWSTNLCL